jgi:linoleoyl-CoA desaturase
LLYLYFKFNIVPDNSISPVRFPKDKNADFATELRKRVDNYFKEKGISKHANSAMIFKTFCMIAMLFIPYFILISGIFESIWIAYLLWTIMGLGVAGIGMSVMHDANHGAYSSKKTVNRLLGRLLDVVGGNATNWKIQHNLLHHTFTNIHGLDNDIENGGLMRFTEHQKRRFFHKYQHWYAWILYGFLTVQWMIYKDFLQMIEFRKKNLEKAMPRKFWKEYTIMLLTKLFYYSYMVVIPLVLLPFAWWQILIGIFIMQFTTGFTLATTFQLAHVMPEAEFPLPDNENNMEQNWMVHQLATTTDFAKNNKLISWYIGGLNFQVEHHLFPNICHIHYNKLAKIVEETAREYEIPYNNIPSLWIALKQHGKLLKELGQKEALA